MVVAGYVIASIVVISIARTARPRIRAAVPHRRPARQAAPAVAAQRHGAAFEAAFEAAHQRKPNGVEAVNLRNAAALAAALDGGRIDIEQRVRSANTLARLLARLGLDRPKPRPHIPTLAQLINTAAANGGAR